MDLPNPEPPAAHPPASMIPKAPTRIRGLDEILKGGLPVGRITMLSGGPGTGKTCLALEFLYRRAEAGEPGLFISFEEEAEALHANAGAIGMDTRALETAGRFKIAYAAIPPHTISSGDFDVQGLMAFLDGHCRLLGAKCIAVDAIDVLMRVFGDPDREREELHLLFDWFRNRGLTAVLTAKTVPSGSQIYPFLDFMADCVIYLDQRIQGQVRTRRLQVIKYRGSGFLLNEHPYVITGNGLVFLAISSMTLADRAPGAPVSSGNDELDAILGGGYLRGSSVLLSGASGSGKTTLACTFLHRACLEGERVVYISLEQSKASLIAEMAGVGLDLPPHLESGRLTILTAMPEAMGVEQHLLRFIDILGEFRPHHLVVDAISACRRMGSEKAVFEFLVRLLTVCKESGITCLCTNQCNSSDPPTQISGTEIASLVEGLLSLEYIFDGEAIRRRLLVIKFRGVAHSMQFHRMSISDRGILLEEEPVPSRNPRPGECRS